MSGHDASGTVEVRNRHRLRTVFGGLIVPTTVTLLAKFWHVEASRPNMSLLAVGCWTLWVVAVVRAARVIVIADDGIEERGLFVNRRLSVEEVDRMTIERANHSVLSVTIHAHGGKTLRLDAAILDASPELRELIDSWLRLLPDEARVESASAVAWF